jgi:hypothetical protein
VYPRRQAPAESVANIDVCARDPWYTPGDVVAGEIVTDQPHLVWGGGEL